MEYTTKKPNGYLALYLEKHGSSGMESYNPVDYMDWIDRLHTEYRKEKGLPADIDLNADEVEEFCKWIKKTA